MTGEGDLAVLLDRSEQTKKFMEMASGTLSRIEKNQIENFEQLSARSTANTTAIKNLDTKVDHKDQSSIERDKQQVLMIRQETTDREEAMAERRRAHDKDISEIKTDIKEMRTD